MFLANMFSSRDCNITSISTALVMLKRMIFGLVSHRKRKGKRYESFTAPLNNIQTLKFKIQPTVKLFNTVSHFSGPHRKQKCSAQQGQEIMFVLYDWRSPIHFVGFCIFVVSRLLPSL